MSREDHNIRVIELGVRMFNMAVWDNEGRQYLPLFGYDDEIVAYAPAEVAIQTYTDVYVLPLEAQP